MDPKDLNKCIKREHFQIPKREEMVCEMAGAHYFSKLDAAPSFVESIPPLEDIPLRGYLSA